MFWYLDWRLQSGGGSYWYFTWKLSSVHIVSKQPGRTPTLSITADLKKNAFWGVCHKILPLPSLGNLLGIFPCIWDSFTNLDVIDELESTRSMSFLRHQLSEKSIPSKAWVWKFLFSNICFNCHFICIASAAERKHIFFTFTTIMIIINIHLMISIMFTSWSS